MRTLIGVHQLQKVYRLDTVLPFIRLAQTEATFNSFLNEVRHKSIIHFFFPREIVRIVLLFLVIFTVFASGPWWFHQSKVVVDNLLFHLPERNWLPSLALVSAAESLANG